MIIRANYKCDICSATKTIDLTRLPDIEIKNYEFPESIDCPTMLCEGRATRVTPT